MKHLNVYVENVPHNKECDSYNSFSRYLILLLVKGIKSQYVSSQYIQIIYISMHTSTDICLRHLGIWISQRAEKNVIT